jgi:hypothetical protein
MPLGLAIILIVAAAVFSWLHGYKQGIEVQGEFTEYWYQDSQEWMNIALDYKDPLDDDDGGITRRPPPSQVKAMAKAAGVGR